MNNCSLRVEMYGSPGLRNMIHVFMTIPKMGERGGE